LEELPTGVSSQRFRALYHTIYKNIAIDMIQNGTGMSEINKLKSLVMVFSQELYDFLVLQVYYIKMNTYLSPEDKEKYYIFLDKLLNYLKSNQ
jgi:hypothetical protein